MSQEAIGLDLTSIGMSFARARLERSNGGPIQFSAEPSRTLDRWGGRSLGDVVREALRITSGMDLVESARTDWPLVRGNFTSRPGPAASLRNHLVGVAYPRGCPPLARRFIPMLLDYPPATAKELPADVKSLIGVEAPVALALQAIAEEALLVPAKFVAGTGLGQSREWTAVTVSREPWSGVSGMKLRFRLGKTVGPEVSDDEVFPALDLGPEAKAYLCGDGPGPAGDRTIRLDQNAVAVGAARFALGYREGWNVSRRVVLGKVEIATECPASLGILGQNDQGDWFWRRLVPAGMPLPSPEIPIVSSSPGPADRHPILIAETRQSGRLWLPRSEWEGADLRIHSTVVPRTAPDPPAVSPSSAHRWTLRALDLDTEASWGLLRWDARYHGARSVSSLKTMESSVEKPFASPVGDG